MEAQKYLARTRVRPALVVVGSFLGIVAIGTALLYSPRAVPLGREPMPLVDAFFTATSAVCVTGLVVRNTGTDYSLFGQGAILVLIQIGGLGLMTFSAFFALALGGGLRLTERIMMKDVIRHDLLGEVGRALTAILVITFVCEAVGAALLYGVWHGTMSVGERLYYSIFHSISAFCNAGFVLYSNNFEEYTGDVRLNVVICALIVIGGIGFVVQSNLLRVLALRAVRLFRPRHGFRPPQIVPTYLSIQTRIVLVTTAALIVVGATGVFLLEWNGQLSAPAMTLGTKVEASLFQSITARTAGFNTLRTGQLSLATLVLLGMLMFIGASPGSTGGGIKTSTFAMLVLTVRAQIRGRDQVEAFHRTIPRDIINRVVVVVTLATMVVAASVLALTISERGSAYLQQQQRDFMQLLFETLSAFGTVGLSTGLTPHLTTAGKIVIMLTMFLGRVGPLTVFVLLGSRALRTGYSYPEEQVLVG